MAASGPFPGSPAVSGAPLTGPIRLVVGLGNPGSRYTETRHNAGFLALEEHARREGLTWQSASKWNSRVAREEGAFLLQPHTFMNRSGAAVAAFARFHKIPPRAILVVIDDLALPFGSLRLRAKGSAGGHNGLESILQSLGTQEIPRLRIGIAPPSEPGKPAVVPAEDWADFVLARFSSTEWNALPGILEKASAEIARALHTPPPLPDLR